jgi:solute carrier family 13 (sodium-dependent dicarboxylate transporter), member 2/3/5
MTQELLTPTVRTAAAPPVEAVAPAPGGPGPRTRSAAHRIDWKRTAFILLGLGLFAAVYLAPPLAPAVDPQGAVFPLGREGKAALALFFLAATWWVTEVVPIGVTSIAIGVAQALFLIRPARTAFTDFMDPSVWFIFGSLMFGMVFAKTGLTRRVAYRMLTLVGERTSMIYLGCFVMTATLTLVMAHTAVAATVFPLFLAIYALYSEDSQPTRFGKGLFIGMAFVAGAGSIITLLGSARAAVAIGFFRDIAGRSVGFFELTYYMLPLGLVMVLVIWGLMLLLYRPERDTIPGLQDRVGRLYASLGPISRSEVLAAVIVLCTVACLSLRSFIPALEPIEKTAIILVATLLFFLLKVVSLDDLEGTSWNIVLLFGGAMSLGFCLWQTGAAAWLAVEWLGLLQGAPWMLFVMGVAAFVLGMTNLIMNVAAIAITMPVALVIAGYVGVAPEVIFYACLVAAGMPFLLLVGAAPNAIAYTSNQFTAREFFLAGVPASLLLLAVLALFVWLIWPAMGMPVLL